MAKKKGMFNKLSNWFTEQFAEFAPVLAPYLKNWLNASTGNAMTDADKEAAALQLENQQTLNAEEYERKIKQYENYESPAAKVRQYQEAGLNPMMLANGGASVSATGGVGSAGSASAGNSGSPSGFSDVLGAIMQLGMYKAQKKAVLAGVQETQNKADALAIENRWKERLNDLRAKEIEQRTKLEGSQFSLNQQTLQKLVHETEYAQTMAIFAPDLFRSQIGERDASAYHHRIMGEVGEKQKSQIEAITEKNRAETEKINAEVLLVSQQISTLASQESLNSARADEARQNIRESVQRIKKIGKEIGLLGADLKYYLWNHAKQVGIGPVKFPMVNPAGSYDAVVTNSEGDIDLFELGPD